MQNTEYEMKSNTYEDLIKNKSLSKETIKQLFEKDIEISNNAVKKAQINIEEMYKNNYGKNII